MKHLTLLLLFLFLCFLINKNCYPQNIFPPLPPVMEISDEAKIKMILQSLMNSARINNQKLKHVPRPHQQNSSRLKRVSKLELRNNTLNNFAIKERGINITKDKAIASFDITDKSGIEHKDVRISLSKRKRYWGIDSMAHLIKIIGNIEYKSQVPTAQSLSTLTMSTATLKQINHPNTNSHVINAHLTQTYLDRKLFSYDAKVDLDALYLSMNAGNVVTFALDPEWNRLVYSYDFGQDNWIKSYGDKQGDYKFCEPRAMAVDELGYIYITDTQNSKIVELFYNKNTKTISYQTSFDFIGLQHPIDISFSVTFGPGYSSYDRLWIADDMAGKLFEIDRSGTLLRTVDSYSINGEQYNTFTPTRVLVTDIPNVDVNDGPYIAFIDGERNAFVIVDGSQIPSTTASVISFTRFTQPRSHLTCIGIDLNDEWWVGDIGLKTIHKFSSVNEVLNPTPSRGKYICSLQNSNWTFNITKFPLFFDNQNDARRSQYIYTSDKWRDFSGLYAFFPGADVVGMNITPTSSSFQFDYTLTNLSQYSAKVIKNIDNTIIYAFAGAGTIDIAGSYHDELPKNLFEYGDYILQVKVLPYYNSFYGDDSLQWLTKELPFSYYPEFTAPENLIGEGLPTYNKLTWAADPNPIAYRIYRNGTAVGTTANNYYFDHVPHIGDTYQYEVRPYVGTHEGPGAFASAQAVHLASNYIGATGSNAQQKMVEFPDGRLVMVYESGGTIFMTSSTNYGTTWSDEEIATDGTDGFIGTQRVSFRNPTITLVGDEPYLAFEQVNIDGDVSDHIIYVYKYNEEAKWDYIWDNLMEGYDAIAPESFRLAPVLAVGGKVIGNDNDLVLCVCWQDYAKFGLLLKILPNGNYSSANPISMEGAGSGITPSLVGELYQHTASKYYFHLVYERASGSESNIIYQNFDIDPSDYSIEWNSNTGENLTDHHPEFWPSHFPVIILYPLIYQGIDSNGPKLDAHIFWQSYTGESPTKQSKTSEGNNIYYMSKYHDGNNNIQWSNLTEFSHSDEPNMYGHNEVHPSATIGYGLSGDKYLRCSWECNQDHLTSYIFDLSNSNGWRGMSQLDVQIAKTPHSPDLYLFHGNTIGAWTIEDNSLFRINTYKFEYEEGKAKRNLEKTPLRNNNDISTKDDSIQIVENEFRRGSVDVSKLDVDGGKKLHGALWFETHSYEYTLDRQRYPLAFSTEGGQNSSDEWLGTAPFPVISSSDSLFSSYALFLSNFNTSEIDSLIQNKTVFSISLFDAANGIKLTTFDELDLYSLLLWHTSDTIVTRSITKSLGAWQGKNVRVKICLIGQSDREYNPAWTKVLVTSTENKNKHLSKIKPDGNKSDVLPVNYALEQNFPNPFNPVTIIKYQLPLNSFVTLKLYDVLGREVVTLVDKEELAGYKSVEFDAAKLPSGIYIYRLIAGNFMQTKKMLLLK